MARAQFVAANLPDLTQLSRFPKDSDDDVTIERVEAFNRAIAAQADAHDMRVVDLFAEPAADDLVSDADGRHPDNRGHRRIAQLLLAVIRKALGDEPGI